MGNRVLPYYARAVPKSSTYMVGEITIYSRDDFCAVDAGNGAEEVDGGFETAGEEAGAR